MKGDGNHNYPTGVKILNSTPLGDAGQALNDNFILLGNRTMTYVHDQSTPAMTWVIQHDLGRQAIAMPVNHNGEVFMATWQSWT